MSGVNDENISQTIAKKTTDPTTIKIETDLHRNYREHSGIKQSRTILLVLLCIELVSVKSMKFIDLETFFLRFSPVMDCSPGLGTRHHHYQNFLLVSCLNVKPKFCRKFHFHSIHRCFVFGCFHSRGR